MVPKTLPKSSAAFGRLKNSQTLNVKMFSRLWNYLNNNNLLYLWLRSLSMGCRYEKTITWIISIQMEATILTESSAINFNLINSK